ncbi:MAG: YceI family protein [bacterium]
MDWNCKSYSPEGFVTFPLKTNSLPSIRNALAESDRNRLQELVAKSLIKRPRGLLWVPVHSFECDNRRMTSDMYNALKADEHRIIIFQYNRFKKIDFNEQAEKNGLNFDLELVGGLAMAGAANSITIETSVTSTTDELLQLQGQFDLKMTDFNITPPTALMGLVKAHDGVQVSYQITVRPLSNPSEAKEEIDEKLVDYQQWLRSDLSDTSVQSTGDN